MPFARPLMFFIIFGGALEVPVAWRPATNRRGPACADPTNERLIRCGAPRASMAACSSSALRSQSSVAKYMVKRHAPPSQGWRIFLRNHAPEIAVMDLFVAPTIGFDLLYAFIIVRLARRDSSGSTSHLIRPRTGLHARSRKHFLGMRPRATYHQYVRI